jgi:hypothetical protein
MPPADRTDLLSTGAWWATIRIKPPRNSRAWRGDVSIFAKLAALARADSKRLTKSLLEEFNVEWGDHWTSIHLAQEEGSRWRDPRWSKRFVRDMAKDVRSGMKRVHQSLTELSLVLNGDEEENDYIGLLVRASLWIWAKEAEWPRLEREIDQTRKAILKVVEMSEQALVFLKKRQRRVGRPRNNLERFWQDNFRVFVIRLLRHVRAAGGHLTLDKNTRTGTLVDALCLLRPHLPPGTIPNAPSMSVLVRLKQLDKKIAILWPSHL